MRSLLLFFFFLSAFQVFSQEPAQITFKENIFNNYTFSKNREKITIDQVRTSMEEYPETLKKFVTGQRNMAIGSGMKIATAILLTSGMIYFIADDFSIKSRNVFLGTGTAGMVLGIVGPGIREEGKRIVSDAVQEYNYQILRYPEFPPSQKSLHLRNPYAFGWKFNF